MQLLVNGKPVTVPESSTVSDLLRQLRIGGRYAVEINRELAPRSTHATTRLGEGDNIEIVQAIGGG